MATWQPESCTCVLEYSALGNDPTKFKKAIYKCNRHYAVDKFLETVMTENQIYSQVKAQIPIQAPELGVLLPDGVIPDPRKVSMCFGAFGTLFVELQLEDSKKEQVVQAIRNNVQEYTTIYDMPRPKMVFV